MTTRDRAGVLRVHDLRREGAVTAVDQRDVARDGGRVGERRAAVGVVAVADAVDRRGRVRR